MALLQPKEKRALKRFKLIMALDDLKWKPYRLGKSWIRKSVIFLFTIFKRAKVKGEYE